MRVKIIEKNIVSYPSNEEIERLNKLLESKARYTEKLMWDNICKVVKEAGYFRSTLRGKKLQILELK
jgi:hypothetical protein